MASDRPREETNMEDLIGIRETVREGVRRLDAMMACLGRIVENEEIDPEVVMEAVAAYSGAREAFLIVEREMAPVDNGGES